MSSSAAVRAAWNTAIWTHATVTAITTSIYAYDIIQDLDSKKEVSRLYYNQKINFFMYQVVRSRTTPELRGGTSNIEHYAYEVLVSYALERDLAETTTSSAHYNTVIDRLETVDGLVLSQLGKTWGNTVQYGDMQTVNPPKLVKLDGKECWLGSNLYVGKKRA